MGKFYDEAFRERHEANYAVSPEFEPSTVTARIEEAERFVSEMQRLLHNG